MEDFKPNSHKFKEDTTKSEDKVIKPVVKGKVSKKKNVGRKFKDSFISEDIGNVKSYVILDVLIPAAKKAISDIITNGIDMLLYGETRHRSEGKRSNVVDYVSYNRYSDRRDDDRFSRSRSIGYSYDDIVLESRAEAEAVLNSMVDLIDTYDVVSVADLYDLVGVSGNFTDNRYGWTNLSSASVERLRSGGYILRLPRATTIK